MTPVAVIVPVFGRECVFTTVAFLRAQPYADSLRFVIVDNGNGPALSNRLAALEGSDCHVIRFDENRGGSAAYISGMGYAMRECPDADWVWLLDDDAVPNAGTLPGLLKTMEAQIAVDPKVASVGSAVVSAEHPGVIAECGARFSPLFGHARPCLGGRRLADVGEVTLPVSYAAACSLLVNKAAVVACGFWEDVFIHFDDIEWGLRVGKAGWRNFATTASTVIHPDFHGYDESRCWMTYFDARNKYWLASKYSPLHVCLARIKNAIFDLKALLTGRLRASIAYRRLAWKDYRSGVRRTRAELLEVGGK